MIHALAFDNSEPAEILNTTVRTIAQKETRIETAVVEIRTRFYLLSSNRNIENFTYGLIRPEEDQTG